MDDDKIFGCGILAVIILLVAFIGHFFTIGAGYGHGSRVGHVVKLSEKGVMCKTFEGQLVLDGAVTVTTKEGTAGIWEFTVKNPEIAKQVEEAMKSGKRVDLEYSQFWHTGPCWGDSDYDVVKVTADVPDKKLP